jgi:serine/threonine protein phosphatase 1
LNKKGQDYFVGDIHGEYDLFFRTLKSVGFSEQNGDRVFSVGDIINRGPDTVKCIGLLKEPWFFSVVGNHEDMLMNIINNPSSSQTLDILRKVGGDWIDEFIDNDPKQFNLLISTLYANMFLAFTVLTEQGQIGVIHANTPLDWSLIQNKKLSDKQERDCLWQAKKFLFGQQTKDT